MCQSNLLPNIYSHTEQDSCCSPKHWASWLTKRLKKKGRKSHLEGNLKQMHRSRKIPRISRYGVKASFWLWADNMLPLLNTGFICDRSRKVFQRCTTGYVELGLQIHRYGLFTAFKPLQQKMRRDLCLQSRPWNNRFMLDNVFTTWHVLSAPESNSLRFLITVTSTHRCKLFRMSPVLG